MKNILKIVLLNMVCFGLFYFYDICILAADEENTKTESINPVLIAILVILVVLLFALIIFMFVLKNKKITEEKRQDDEAYLATYQEMMNRIERERMEEEMLKAKIEGVEGTEDFLLQIADGISKEEGEELLIDISPDDNNINQDIKVDFQLDDSKDQGENQ